jgi:hypothetical protein
MGSKEKTKDKKISAKRLNEALTTELKELNELNLDPELKAAIDKRHSDELAKRQPGIDRAKEYTDKYPGDKFWQNNYEDALKGFKDPTAASKYFRALYNSTNIDLNKATFNKIETPTNGRKFRSVFGAHEYCLLELKDEGLLLCAHSDEPEGFRPIYVNNKLGSQEVHTGKNRLNLNNSRGVIRAINAGMVINAWAVDNVERTGDLQKKRRAAQPGYDISRGSSGYGWGERDKSGYPIDPDKYKRQLAKLKAERGGLDIKLKEVVDLYKKVTAEVFEYMNDPKAKSPYDASMTTSKKYQSYGRSYTVTGLLDSLHSIRSSIGRLMDYGPNDGYNGALGYERELDELKAKLLGLRKKVD